MKTKLLYIGIIIIGLFLLYYFFFNQREIKIQNSDLMGEIETISSINLAGIEFPCSNNNTIEYNFQDLSEAFIEVEKLDIKPISSKIFVVGYNFPKNYVKDMIFTEYTCFVGIEVQSASPSIKKFTIPRGKYIFVNLPVGLIQDISIFQEVYIRKFTHILKDKKILKLRKNRLDFEIYTDNKFTDRNVKIYIGV